MATHSVELADGEHHIVSNRLQAATIHQDGPSSQSGNDAEAGSTEALGYDVHLLVRSVNGKTLYSVALGHYRDTGSAKQAQRDLFDLKGLKSYVIEYALNAREIGFNS